VQFDVTIKKSKRKTISIRVTKGLGVIVGAPLRMQDKDIALFVERHRPWIEKHLLIQKAKNENSQNFTGERIKQLKIRALEIVSARVSHYSEIMGVSPAGVKITSAGARWGSCSARNSLCFPYKIALLPEELVDYIVVHELAHIRVKNHGKGFYREVESFMPDYRARIKKIKEVQKDLGI
jgi:predicted metal-dependent hydrolase